MGTITPILPPSSGTGSINILNEVFEIPGDVIGNTITLANTPTSLSDIVSVNGLTMAIGLSFDYTITTNVITFNSGVLTTTGTITVNYSY